MPSAFERNVRYLYLEDVGICTSGVMESIVCTSGVMESMASALVV